MRLLIFLTFFAWPLAAQETRDLSKAETIVPYKLRTLEPGHCAIGEAYLNTATGTLRRCIAPNTWANATIPDGGNPGDGVVNIVRRGLLAEYRMIDAAGGVLPDSSGGGFHGTINGSPAISDQGIAFGGSPQRVDLPAGIAGHIVSACFFADLGTTLTSAGSYTPLLGSSTNQGIHLLGGVAAAYPNTQSAIFGLNAGRSQAAGNLPYGPGQVCMVLDPASDKIYQNGVETPSYVTHTGSSGVTQAGTIQLAAASGYGLYAVATIHYVTLYSVALTAAEIETNYRAMRQVASRRGVRLDLPAVSTANTIVVDGDSISAPVGQGGATTWPSQLHGLTDTFTAPFDFAIVGRTLGEISIAATVRADPIYSPSAARNVYVVFAGTNDFIGGSTPTQVYAALLETCRGRRQRGFQVVVVPMVSRSGNAVGGTLAALDTQHDLYNALIMSNWPTFADAIVDPAAYPALYGDAAYNNVALPTACGGGACFQGDGIHPTTAGGLVLATAIGAAINSLNGAKGQYVQATDPGCALAYQIGRQWLDTTTSSTAFKVCLSVAGSLGWITK